MISSSISSSAAGVGALASEIIRCGFRFLVLQCGFQSLVLNCGVLWLSRCDGFKDSTFRTADLQCAKLLLMSTRPTSNSTESLATQWDEHVLLAAKEMT